MITVKELVSRLSILPEDALCYVDEAQVSGIAVIESEMTELPNGLKERRIISFIECDEIIL